ncbi:MAG: putative multidrug resistance protein MdtD [Deltaproteobacteria bacterium]|jgi:MFS family permease|nr:putative multidrug resistance protein MdtD [Deltaproteobacteria bacterium]
MDKLRGVPEMSINRQLLNLTAADFIVRTAYQMGKTPLLPLFAASLGANATFLGFIVSASTLTGILLKPMFGLLSDRWGRWIWFFTGTLLFTVTPFLYLWIETPDELLLLRLIHGLATAIYGPVTVAWVMEQGQEYGIISHNCAERLGWFGMGRCGGYLLGPTLAAALLTIIEPETVFTLIGLLSSFAFFPVLLLKNRDNPQRHCKSWRIQITEALSTGFQTAELWLAGILEFVVYLGLYAAKTFLPLYALQQGIPVLWVGVFFTTQELIHLVARPYGGRLSDRLGYLPVTAAGMMLAALSLGLLPLVETSLPLLLLAIVFGLAQALIFPSTLALYAHSMDSSHTGAGAGLIGALKNSGKIAGPIIGGLIIHWHDYSWMLWSMAALLTLWSIGLLLSIFCRKSFAYQWESR